MKKLIAISVVFALIAGTAFAVDLGGTVTGTVNVLEGDTGKDSKVTSSAELNRTRLDGSGEVADGVFGGYIRVEGFEAAQVNKGDFTGNSWEGDSRFFLGYGNAWWKPIDQFKLLVGSNGGDGFIGKEGVTGWMFQQTAYDTGVALGAGNIWGGGYGATIYRNAFFEGGGDGGNAAYLFITPLDILGINVILPFFNGGETADVFKKAVFQLDLHLDFGNIAVTYQGDLMEGDDQPSIFAYFGGSFGDLSLDVGLGYHLAHEGDNGAQPISIGLGVKYALDTFGVKFRTVASLAGDDKQTAILAEVLPYFNLGDNLTAFVSAGLALTMPDGDETVVGWHFNPYLQVGEEWGAKFLAGIKAWSDGKKDAEDKTTIHWGVPIAVSVSF